jgi:two-component sensor histidine kinase
VSIGIFAKKDSSRAPFYGRPPGPPVPVVTLDLALAVIASSNAPLLLLDGNLKIIVASKSFCHAFGIDPAAIDGCELSRLGADEWAAPQLSSLLHATASGFAKVESYQMELRREGQEVRFLAVNAQKLDYADPGNIRLLLTVSDVTAARDAQTIRETLLREKDVLLQELHHRVANRLQIIASVLLQSARKVQSDETRKHLRDAHHRIMSVAALQQHLSVSRSGDVELRSYFIALCDSIGASMISDHHLLSLKVNIDESSSIADTSVSLGLIVTELVINALKHAFPDNRSGTIIVSYRTRGGDWTLSVSDNGAGMPANPTSAKAGLGTTIIEALAKRLGANVELTDANPGTTVSIVHAHVPVIAGRQVEAPATPAV